MKNYILSFLLLMGAASAAPILTLNPANGALKVEPGGTSGWGFSLTSENTRWLSVIGSTLLTESNPGLGTYTDLIGALGGPVDFALAPLAAAWQLDFDNSLGFGVGSYTVNANAAIGAVNSGILRVIVEAYSDSPSVCGGNCVVETLTFDAPFSVSSEVPEPATIYTVALVVLGIYARRHMR
jgi:hypothetical protein